MAKKLMKGNEAVVRGAILAGCRAFFGYPITPASEIAETAAVLFPKLGGVFLQAESEVAAINMLFGAASGGIRAMTASSSPGISLMQEGISYAAGAELPMVIVNIMRGGPGLGNIAPEQGDYNQNVKGGGHGNYKLLVLAPNSVQEMCDLTYLAFDLADKYRNPVVILADGFIGQMMEPVEFPDPKIPKVDKSWTVDGTAETRENLITSIYLSPEELEKHNLKLCRKYERMKREEVRFEVYKVEDADVILVGYGIVSRILKSVVDLMRDDGYRVGLLRPITLFPFPEGKICELAERVSVFFVVELSTGQMVDDVRLALNGRSQVKFYGRFGGMVPSVEEIIDQVREVYACIEREAVEK
jgi:pyruvate/2-oxoacid:ferredoxin oxidoreductase alpha subunit